MTFLPIVERELRLAARRRRTYWMRTFATTIAIVLGVFIYANSHEEASEKISEYLFESISWTAFIYCFCAGMATADCISEEKREGTLGLLFLTDLKGYDVVIGKLAATSLGGFYNVLAIIPVLAVPLLMGGTTNGEFCRMAVVLLNTFGFSLCIGIFVSSISKFPRRAMAGTLLLLAIFAFGFPIGQRWTSFNNGWANLNLFFHIGTPVTAIVTVPDAVYKTSADEFWWSVGFTFAASFVLLALASLIVPRSWKDKPASAKGLRWRENWHRWSYGEAEDRRVFRSELLDINAFYWLAGRARLKPTHVWLALAGYACLWSWGAASDGRGWLNSFTYFLTALILNTTFKIWITSEAGYRLGQDRKIGALELLLSTSISVPDILRGQLLALRRQFLLPLLTVMAVEAALLVASVTQDKLPFEETRAMVLFGFVMMIMLVADVFALSACAMWTGLTAKNPNRTTGMVLRRILVLPWVGIILVMIVLESARNSPGADIGTVFMILYVITGVAADFWFGIGAWTRLKSHFREMAVQRYSPPGSVWKRIIAPSLPPGETPPLSV